MRGKSSLLGPLAMLVVAGTFAVERARAQKDEGPGEAKAATFKYPGATGGFGSTISGERLVFTSTMVTDDDDEKVFAFYRERTGVDLLGKGGGACRILGDSMASSLDLSPALADGEAGPKAMVRVFDHDTDDHHLTLVFTRARGEARLHIALSYMTHR